ncbi:MAG: cytochrome c biogenesis protein CcdA [Candidatus Omnitrophica bacterium]|nr:cytochrome c biogenesis protein CcdA [Candidatus Omnitrophota bacterium]MCM8777064.1 cytochrome c biogenesis protein CcdA [Candidatus Omnitrophota bacterium]
METTQNYSVFLSFTAGILSFFSPCILPLIPVYLSYITGVSIENIKGGGREIKNLSLVLFFIAGFTFIFTLLGASATYLGRYLLTKQNILRICGGVIIIIFGLHLSGIFKITTLYRQKKIQMNKVISGYTGAFLIGMVFAAGWTPCVGPVLASILIIASYQKTVLRGIILLTFYSIGIGIPFIITTILINRMLNVLSFIKKHTRTVEIITGLLLIAMGILFILNKFNYIMPM